MTPDTVKIPVVSAASGVHKELLCRLPGEPIPFGTEAKCYVTAELDSGSPKPFIDRPYCLSALTHWRALELSGLPVAREIYVSQGLRNNRMFVIDVAPGTAEVYGRHQLEQLVTDPHHLQQRLQQPTAADRLLLDIKPGAVQAGLQRLAKQATEVGIKLPPDGSCELIVHPDHNTGSNIVHQLRISPHASLAIIDTLRAQIHHHQLSKEESRRLEAINQYLTGGLGSNIARIQRLLRP